MVRICQWRLPMLLGLVLVSTYPALGEEEEGQPPAQEQQAEPKELTIGSPAPPLDIEHWVQNGNGKFSAVTEFEPDKVYIVEFWATWCGPCINSMPHLAATQQKYAEAVQLISISDEDLKTVEGFLERKVRGDEQKTYRELTSAYCLTTDPDRSNHTNYMRAAKQNGIPTAFIVGKDGHVEWIGHPMRMDEPLEQIVNDEWDREAFKAQFIEQQKLQESMQAINVAMSQNKVDDAIKIVDELIASASGPAANNYRQLKLRILLHSGKEGALELARTIAGELEDGNALNEFAWAIYQAAEAGRTKDEQLVQIAVEAAEKAVEKTEGQLQGNVLDTVAHLKHHQGDLDAAIEYQTRAVELSPAEPIKEFLKKLQEEKGAGAEDKEEQEEEKTEEAN